MAKFSRYGAAPSIKGPVDDDEDAQLKALAKKRLDAAVPSIAPKPAAAPRPANVAVRAPARITPPAPTAATKATTPKGPTVVNPAPSGMATTSDKAAALRRQALDQIVKEDRGGMRTGQGITVEGNGNREDTAGQTTYVPPSSRTPTGPSIGADVNRRRREDSRNTDLNAMGDELEQDFKNQGDDGDAVGHAEQDAEQVANIQTGTTKEERDARADDGVDDLARQRLDADQKAERDAAAAELKAGKAKALMMANARAQLAGMGLGGGTAALESDIGRTQDRSAVLAMSQLGRTQRDEGRDDRRLTAEEKAAAANQKRAETNDAFLALQRKAAIDRLEAEEGVDVDGDGDVDGETEEEVAQREALERIMAEKADDAAEPQDFVGHIGHTVAFDGALPIPDGVDVSGARTIATVNPTDQHYVGTKGGYHYYQSASTGEFVRVEAT